MPADHGSSGKKFPNQRMALSHAYDTWGVPPPNEKPGKPYTRNDLVGKEIVLEGTAKTSSSMPSIVILSSNSNKRIVEAFSQWSSAKFSGTHRVFGKNTIKNAFENAAYLGLVMGYGAAANSVAEFVNTDAMNFDNKKKVDNDVTGQKGVSAGDWPTALMGTCDTPDPDQFKQLMSTPVNQFSKLYNSKKNTKGGVETTSMHISQPGFSQPGESYKHVYFSDIKNVRVTATVGALGVAEFKKVMNSLVAESSATGPLKSAVSDTGVSFAEERSADPNKRSNAVFSINFPFDLFKTVEARTAKTARIKFPSPWITNLQKIFDAAQAQKCFRQEGENEVPVSVTDLISGKIPIMEHFSNMSGASALVYDPRGVPLGIILGRKQRMGLEEFSPNEVVGEEGATGVADEEEEDRQKYDIKKSARQELLQKAGGNPVRLREMLHSGEIQLRPDMFVISETCPYELNPIITDLANVDPKFNVPIDPAGGKALVGKKVGLIRDSISPATQPSALKVDVGGRQVNVVRTVDPKTRRQKIVEMPEGVQPQQLQSGSRTLVEDSVIWTRNEAGQWYSLNVGEWHLVDDEGKGKFVVGATTRTVLRPLYRSSKGTDKKVIHSKGQQRQGYYMGTVDMWASKQWVPGAPKDMSDPTIEVVKDAAGNVVGYYHMADRQHPETPFSKGAPTVDEPMIIQTHKIDENGDVVRGEELKVTADQAVATSSGLLFFDGGIAMNVLGGVLALDEGDIGAFTPVNGATLSMVDDLTIAAKNKFQAIKAGTLSVEQLSEPERILYEVTENKDFTMLFSKIASAVEGSDPAAFSPRTGTLWGVKDPSGKWAMDLGFATEEVANGVAKMLEEAKQQPMTVKIKEENASLVAGKKVGEVMTKYLPPEIVPPQPPQAPESEGEEAPVVDPIEAIEQALQQPPVMVDVPGAAEGEIPTSAPEPGMPAAPAPIPETPVETGVPIPEQEPEIPFAVPYEEPAPAAQAPTAPLIAPQPVPAQPAPATPPEIPMVETEEEKRRKREQMASRDTIARLIALANRLDEDGRIAEAEMVDRVAKKASERAAAK